MVFQILQKSIEVHGVLINESLHAAVRVVYGGRQKSNLSINTSLLMMTSSPVIYCALHSEMLAHPWE